MATMHFGQDVNKLARQIKELLEEKDATLMVSTDMHGGLKSPSSKINLIRVPTAFCGDCLDRKGGLPPGAIFIGLMILPKELASKEMMANDKAGMEAGR